MEDEEGRWRIVENMKTACTLSEIVVPLARPSIVAAVLLVSTFFGNEFFSPVIPVRAQRDD